MGEGHGGKAKGLEEARVLFSRHPVSIVVRVCGSGFSDMTKFLEPVYFEVVCITLP